MMKQPNYTNRELEELKFRKLEPEWDRLTTFGKIKWVASILFDVDHPYSTNNTGTK